MPAALMGDEHAAVALFQHGLVEGARAGVGGDGVAGAVEGEGGRQAGADVVGG